MFRFLRTALWLTPVALASTQSVSYEQRPALLLSNGTLNVTILEQGAVLAGVTIPSDPDVPNPLWNSARLARENGREPQPNSGLGHFVCVDGFGQPSAAEKGAGLPSHGEAHTLKMSVTRDDAAGSLQMKTTLPIMQEVFTRTFHLVPGESVLYVDSELQNLLGFDRPISWAEHATISAPFIQPGETFVEISGSRSQNRPYTVARAAAGGNPRPTDRRLVSGADFKWPLAPALGGGTVDMRTFPDAPHYIDHTATLMDTSRETEFAVGFNRAKHLVYGYLFRRADYPWIQNWGSYPGATEEVRGMEFGTQPYDIPRHDAVTMGTLFGAPTFKWLPAKGTADSHYLVFYSRTPQHMEKIDDVRLENGSVVIEDRANHERVVLAASRGLDGGNR